MRPVNGFQFSSSLSAAATCATVAAFLMASPVAAKSKKQDEETRIEPCPIDTTLRTADPNLLKRFRSLAGCEDQLLVAPASELDFVDPDGRVIIGESNDDGDAVADDDEGGYRLQYADMKPGSKLAGGDDEDEDAPPPKSKKAKQAEMEKQANRKGTEVQVYSYNDRPTSLSGTGTVVRIIPEEMPQPAAGASYAPGYAPDGTLGAAPQNSLSSGILAMRPQSYRTRFDEIISQTANNHRIDPLLLHAVIQQESGYRQTARSHVGAQGLMQIMPGTGRQLGVHPAHLNDPVINVDAGARLLRRLYFKYDGNFDLILAAYNAGEGAVQKYGNRVPPYRETQNYVKMVMQRYNKLLAEQNGAASRP
jgi:Transglycosylase SLT domain